MFNFISCPRPWWCGSRISSLPADRCKRGWPLSRSAMQKPHPGMDQPWHRVSAIPGRRPGEPCPRCTPSLRRRISVRPSISPSLPQFCPVSRTECAALWQRYTPSSLWPLRLQHKQHVLVSETTVTAGCRAKSQYNTFLGCIATTLSAFRVFALGRAAFSILLWRHLQQSISVNQQISKKLCSSSVFAEEVSYFIMVCSCQQSRANKHDFGTRRFDRREQWRYLLSHGRRSASVFAFFFVRYLSRAKSNQAHVRCNTD